MSSKLRTETFDANGRIVVGSANFFMLIATASAVDVKFFRDGTSMDYEGLQAGFVKGLVRPFERGTITGVAGSSCSFFIGDEEITEDFTDYRRTVGVFQSQLAASVLGTTDVAVGAAATTIIAANAARRKVTIKVISGDTNIRVGPSGTVATTRGLQLELGQSYTFEGTGELSGIREGGTAAGVAILEEIY
jgi:hypothetical protein